MTRITTYGPNGNGGTVERSPVGTRNFSAPGVSHQTSRGTPVQLVKPGPSSHTPQPRQSSSGGSKAGIIATVGGILVAILGALALL